mmetsp:Transcript_11898/g.13711  ORF Transcript_11898/g.13711 Transcript_11898/m.13711 type:complete len:175 (-) Transcript_11898:70-594(-)
MCKTCVLEPFPDRGTTVLDSGSYLLNLNTCTSCGKKSMPLQVQEKTQNEESDGSDSDQSELEITTFVHQCSNEGCGHVIAEHFHRFHVESNRQEYFMECLLCGRGTDSSLIHRGTAAEDDPYVNIKQELEAADEAKAKETPEQKKAREDMFEALANTVPVIDENEDNDSATDWD